MGAFQPQVATGSFEISASAAAFEQPFGPTVADLAAQLGFITGPQKAYYDSLPTYPGLGKDNFIESLVNGQTSQLGYDPVGLNNSNIQVSNSIGGYVATHIYGWTEFNVDRDSKALTITTYGIPSYTYAELHANTAAVTGRQPTVWQQFQVQPVIGPTSAPAGRRLAGRAGACAAPAGASTRSAVRPASASEIKSNTQFADCAATRAGAESGSCGPSGPRRNSIQEHGGENMRRIILASLAASLIGFTAAASAAKASKATPPQIDVMTQNQYIGADIAPLIAAIGTRRLQRRGGHGTRAGLRQPHCGVAFPSSQGRFPGDDLTSSVSRKSGR